MMGPRIIGGSIATIIEVARIVAEPVFIVRYQARANSTIALPNKEKAWLTQMIRNFLMEVS
jgi:hypothetical protein